MNDDNWGNQEQESVGTKWLQEACDTGVSLVIYLVNGVKLRGRVCDFDDDHMTITFEKYPKFSNMMIVNRRNISSMVVDKNH